MTVHFSLPYRTTYGQRLVLCGSLPALGHWQLAQALPLHYDEATTRWSAEIEVPAAAPITYKYVLLFESGGVVWEWGDNRTLALPDTAATRLEIRDFWRAPAQDDNELFTAAFTKALFRRPAPAAAQAATAKVAKAKKGKAENPATAVATSAPNLRLSLAAPRVATQHQLCVLGSDPALGAWDQGPPVVLSDAAYPAWQADVTLQNPDKELTYKYGLWDAATQAIVQLETGDNRVLPAGSAAPDTLRVLHDEGFRYA
ncbi:MAG: hypothetical protein EOO36_16020, partial [Cytophagaceae bacterium]